MNDFTPNSESKLRANGRIIELIIIESRQKRDGRGKNNETWEGRDSTVVFVTVSRFTVMCNWFRNYSTLEAFYWIGLRMLRRGEGGIAV